MVESPLFWLALATLVLWTLGAVEAAIGTRRLHDLRDLPPMPGEQAPAVSVVIAARNEERNLEEALRSVLAQRYPRLEVVVVDDRSTDRTGEILDRMAAADGTRLRVIHLSHLPEGWLGKNHALLRGVEAAGGDWVLFTDADVVMESSVISRAVGYATREGLDHLALAPDLDMPGPLLDVFGGTFSLLFSFFARPWRARDPRSRHHIGVGAFNLVRTEAYLRVGGHRPLALRPDDDMKLGKLLKMRGCSQDMVFGRGLVAVEWYHDLREVVHGLEKNTFAAMEYSLARVAVSSAALLTTSVWPFAALFLTGGATLALNAACVLLILAVYVGSARGSGSRPLLAPAFPLAILLLVYIMLRSAVVVLRDGGIRWRGTLYPIGDLRANRL